MAQERLQRQQAESYAQMLATALEDPTFKQRLVADPSAVLRERCLPVPGGQAVKVVENTADTVYLVVPAKPDTERSGEPLIRVAEAQQGSMAQLARVLINASHDEAFKKRLMVNPATTLGEHGISAPDGKTIRVVENTNDTVHLVLPAKPTQAELSDEQLDQVAGGLVDDVVEGIGDFTFTARVTFLVSCNLLNFAKDPWG
jgi:hypothetical protein